jgi:aminoglycoside phosphotransferase (APT) family kinase protein
MRHGYTNSTERRADLVHKTYDGPNAHQRCAAELRALTTLEKVLPVPAVISNGPGALVTAYVAGEHGQDLIDAGRAQEVLTGCGTVLRQLHELDPAILEPGADGVIRHGDFGPNNVLFDPDTMAVTAVLDWEFSGIGAAIEDIAWCEWIVRMHHPDAVGTLPAFFDAYGSTPPWEQRKRAMLSRCRWLEAFCKRWDPHGVGMRDWHLRAVATASWDC